MKKHLLVILSLLFSTMLFAQTKAVEASKLVSTLEKNKKTTIVFTSSVNLKGISVKSDGALTIPSLASEKIKFIAGIDTEALQERLNYKNLSAYNIELVLKDVATKTYEITKIAGIESVSQYEERKEAERIAEEKRKEQERLDNLTKNPVQVVNFEAVNLSSSETSWLPLQIQDKLKSNLQTYLGMKTVVDSKSESALKKLQAASESAARDENTTIEVGKITTAKFALFTKVRKIGANYVVAVDFTDLTTGEQLASCLSKEYSKPEYLYGSTGAVDEVTIALSEKLQIQINDLNKNLLTKGTADFSVDQQLELAKQNEEQFQKMMADYDAQLSKLMTSNDIHAIQNKKRIEAEKALLKEKQNAERKRQEELNAQKQRQAADAKLEAERSIALKTQRDKMAQEAAAKAAQVRKLKMEKQGVLGQINILESKKKALVEIRQGVENRCIELHEQLKKDRPAEENRIRNKTYSTVELGSDGKPTEAALKRRENQITASYKSLTEKFFADCANVKNATATQDSSLLAEIRADQKNLAVTRTVSSMGDELKVSFGNYEGSRNGWNAYLSLYSDGIQLYTDSFIVNYETLSGKKAPNMETELNDSVIEEYTNNVDMYSSLLTRGDPIIYFELDYNVTAENDDKPSMYKFNFTTVRVINTVSEKTVQTSNLNKNQSRTMSPSQDLREIVGIVAKEKEDFNLLNSFVAKGFTLSQELCEIVGFFSKEKKIYLLNSFIAKGFTLAEAKEVYKKMGAIGDIAYSDGSVSEEYDNTKIPIGIVIEVSDEGVATKIVSLTETKANWNEAKRWCYNYRDASGSHDWHLPSKEELYQLYGMKNTVNTAIDEIIAGGGFAIKLGTGCYWAFSLYRDNDFAWGRRFSDGRQDAYDRFSTYSVRAVRAF